MTPIRVPRRSCCRTRQVTAYSEGAAATSASTAAFSNVNVPEADRRKLTIGFTAGR